MDSLQIEATLDTLSRLYQKYENRIGDESSLKMAMISKLAILELSGWLEEEHDAIIELGLERINDSLSNSHNQSDRSKQNFNKLKSHVVKQIDNTHGVSYDNHFCKLLEALLGQAQLIKLEVYLDEFNMTKLQDVLNQLHEKRKALAHTSVFNVSQQSSGLTRPHDLLNDFRIIKPILQNIRTFLLNY